MSKKLNDGAIGCLYIGLVGLGSWVFLFGAVADLYGGDWLSWTVTGTGLAMMVAGFLFLHSRI